MSIERLQMLRIDNAIKGEDMQAESGRFMRPANRHDNGTAPRIVTAFNLFQTPEPIAACMAELVAGHVEPGARILEPSAGLGRLFRPLAERLDEGARFVLVDESPECLAELYRLTDTTGRDTTIKGADFLSTRAEDLGGMFDAVIMNPPFKMWRDIKHIQHAVEMLKPGGLLVALCANGPKQNEQLRPMADTWEVLPEGSFRSEGTGASVAMLTIRKGCES